MPRRSLGRYTAIVVPLSDVTPSVDASGRCIGGN